ncbi:MAG: hypothetical protein CSB24_05995 [Deltaproteobacteria bacterium]|nr:MAG: hypothetical protein CSB24_05995 [Deltaproteobacteria bacterium]
MRIIRLLKNDLAREASLWVEDKIISPEQAAQICSRYGADYFNQKKSRYGYFVLTMLGVLFIGLAIITIVSANWENIPRWARMLGLISLTMLTNLLGIKRAADGGNNAAVGWFFLGGLFYGASIMLIAQIYHIGEHYPDGIFWWAAGILPIALLMKSTLLLLLAAALSGIWFFTESSLGFYPALFPVFLSALAWHCFKVKKNSFLFLALVCGLGCWLEYSYSWLLGGFNHFEAGVENLALGISIFILLYGLAHRLAADKKWEDYGILLGTWVLRFTLFSLIIFSFDWAWKEVFRAEWLMPPVTIGLAVLCSVFSALLVKNNTSRLIFISAAAIIFTGILLVITAQAEIGGNMLLVFQVADNIILLISGAYLIIAGIQGSITHYFFLGIITILLTALIRYIDLIGNYIGASFLFILFAVILFSAAHFWKKNNQGEVK